MLNLPCSNLKIYSIFKLKYIELIQIWYFYFILFEILTVRTLLPQLVLSLLVKGVFKGAVC